MPPRNSAYTFTACVAHTQLTVPTPLAMVTAIACSHAPTTNPVPHNEQKPSQRTLA